MKTFTIYYREKGNGYGLPIAKSVVKANTWQQALTLREYYDKTWHSIFCDGIQVISLNEVRRSIK